MTPILQERLPFAPWTDPRVWRLPGTQAARPEDWVRVDEAYSAQMGLRRQLISRQRGDVLALLPEAQDAAAELMALGLEQAAGIDGFEARSGEITCPDGQSIEIDTADPMGTLGRMFQEDLCLLQKPAGSDEHVLTGAVLCFPAGWRLSEKIGRPLGRIHEPVPRYGDVAHRVQRMFDGLKIGQPVWRANAHFYDDPALFAPRAEADPRADEVQGNYVRSEYQVLFRLPASGAIVFSIHTYVVARLSLSRKAEAALRTTPLFSGQ